MPVGTCTLLACRDVVNTYLDDAGLTLADWTDPERWAMEAEASAPGDALLLQGLAILEEATFCVWVPAINEKNKEEALPPSVLKFQPLAADAADADLVERADSNAYWLSHVSHLGSGDANIYRAHLFMSDDALAELAESAEELMALADEAAPAADAANAGAPGLGGAGDGGDDDDSGDVARPELPAALDAQLPEGEAVDEVSSLAGWSSGLSGASAGPSVLPTKPPVSPPPATDLAPGGGAPPTFEFGPPAPSTAQLTLVLDRSLEQEAPALLAQLAEHMPLGLSGGCRWEGRAPEDAMFGLLGASGCTPHEASCTPEAVLSSRPAEAHILHKFILSTTLQSSSAAGSCPVRGATCCEPAMHAALPAGAWCCTRGWSSQRSALPHSAWWRSRAQLGPGTSSPAAARRAGARWAYLPRVRRCWRA